LLAVLLQAFFFKLFKIPTGSMEPTLHGASHHRWLGQPYGDHILVNKFIYGPATPDWIGLPWFNLGFEVPCWRMEKLAWRKPERGDIIVFKFPFNYACNNRRCRKEFNAKRGTPLRCPYCGSSDISYQNKDFIKRVIGLPGETVEIKDGDIYINDELVTEPRIIKDIYYTNIAPHQGPYGRRGQKFTVPDGRYFVLGDNSVNSRDSRFWGFVPFENIRGKAFFIYLPPGRFGFAD
jgi:signal peptidase I